MPKRSDANQPAIIAALRQVGAWVFDCHALGNGFADLYVVYRGRVYLFEVKTPGGRLTPREVEFMQAQPPFVYHIVRSPEEAVEILEVGG